MSWHEVKVGDFIELRLRVSPGEPTVLHRGTVSEMFFVKGDNYITGGYTNLRLFGIVTLFGSTNYEVEILEKAKPKLPTEDYTVIMAALDLNFAAVLIRREGRWWSSQGNHVGDEEIQSFEVLAKPVTA